MNTPDPPHWTLNTCIGVFCSVWVHFGWFHYCMKLGAKWAELEQLIQKFMPRSRIKIFCSEPTRSTALDPKLMFWCVSLCLGAIVNVFVTTRNFVQNGLNWCNQCTSFCHKVASEFFATNAPNPPHWTLNSCFGAFLSLGCIWQCFITTRNSVQNGLNWCN